MSALAVVVALGLPAIEASGAPQRWVFDVVDAQTSAVVGSAGVVAQVDDRVAPAVAYYSLQVSSKALTSGSYRAQLAVNGLLRSVDFSAEASGEVRVRVDPLLALPISTATAAVPAVNVYSGEYLAYRGVLRRGDSGSGPADGMGGLSGQCGVMTFDVVAGASPYLFKNALDFWSDQYDAGDFTRLSSGAQAILGSPAPSTSAVVARAFAFEVLRRCEGAQLLKTADEIKYVDSAGKSADMLVAIGGRKIGVTSTRAFRYPPSDPYTVANARVLLERALNDVLLSNQNVAAADRWAKQVLHVFAYGYEHAASLEAAYADLDSALKASTILLITVTDGADSPLYF
jgi:hypothetical protein